MMLLNEVPHDSDGAESPALSLRDLPIKTESSPDGRRSPPPPHDVFEFFPADLSAEMCSADDIFLRGHLLPCRPPSQTKKTTTHHPKPLLPLSHRRSASLSAIDAPRGSLAADCRTMRRASSESAPARPRPRWYMFVFGSVRLPAAMEMRDIRNRQRRRNPSPPSAEGGTWRFLRSLSCKGVDGALPAVTAPLSSY